MKTREITLSILDNVIKLDGIFKLDIGKNTITQLFSKTEIPTPYQIEVAIIHIEDAIATIQSYWHSLVQHYDVKIIADKKLLKDFFYFSVTKKLLSIEEVELTFNRVTDIVSGNPIRDNELLLSHNAISLLVIVREIIHHLHIEKIYFK